MPRRPMTALALTLRPIDHGWGVYLTNGQELAHYRGLFSKQLALRYLRRYAREISASRRSRRNPS